MKLLWEIGILIFIYKLGDYLTLYLHLPVPPVLTGMVLLLLLLTTGMIKPDHLERSSQFFSRHMILFFIPVIVGIMQYGDILKQGGWNLIFTVVVSTIFVLVSTAYITLIFRKRREIK